MSSRSQRFDAQVLDTDNVYAFKVLEGSLSTLILSHHEEGSYRVFSVLSPYPLALLHSVNVVRYSDRSEESFRRRGFRELLHFICDNQWQLDIFIELVPSPLNKVLRSCGRYCRIQGDTSLFSVH